VLARVAGQELRAQASRKASRQCCQAFIGVRVRVVGGEHQHLLAAELIDDRQQLRAVERPVDGL
jgi:hypothetical protein